MLVHNGLHYFGALGIKPF